jgi:putative transposase
VSLSRSKYYYKPKKDKLKDIFILNKIKDIATNFPSYGYRRVVAALRREGTVVNHKESIQGLCELTAFAVA